MPREAYFVSVFVVALMLAAGASAEDENYDWKSWGSVVDTVYVTEAHKRVALSSPFIVSGSETVLVNGGAVPADYYEINYQRGLIRFNTAFEIGTVVTVAYTRLPFLLNSVYSLRSIELADAPQTSTTATIPIKKKETRFNPVGNLSFGGVKSISFETGTNKGTSLDQALRATVEGDLTKSIKVRALLSDNNLPIQPEGNTEELEYLDKVFVEFIGPRARATLGDYSFENRYSSFSAFRRELQGASGQATFGSTTLEAAAGSSKGVFQSITFRGTEQLQGPYDLLSPGRVTGEVVIAGTEKVYFDGGLLQRGQNRDYTIDYDRGTLTFTPRRLVTADTEISVDFEATQEQYDRTSVFGGVDSQELFGGLTFQALLARERDDSDRPQTIQLDDQDRGVLEAAGDNTQNAITGGISFVGIGEGDYNLIPGDSLAGIPDRFEFSDSTGAFDVTFVEVGAGNGDYVLSGITATGKPIYRFEGIDQGNYDVGRQLPLPQSHSVVTTHIFRPGKGRFDFDLQYNISDFDANTFSSIDDGNNTGDAGKLRLGLRDIPARVGVFEVVGSLSTIEERFRSLDRSRASFFYRDWNLENVPLKGRELLQNLTASFVRGKKLRLDYDLGSIKRDDFDGQKQEGRLTLSTLSDRQLKIRGFSTDVQGNTQDRTRKHGSVSGSYGLWRVNPSFAYTTEEFFVTSPSLPDTGIAYDRYHVRLAKRNFKRFNYALEAEQRDTQERADTTNGWIDTRRDRTLGLLFAARGTGPVQGELQYTHRIEDNFFIGDRRTSDLARLKAVFRADGIGFRSNLDYEISQNQFRTQQKTVIFVGEGLGDFNQLGEAVGKGRGDYTVVFLPTLQTIPTRAVDLTLHTSFRAGKARYKKGSGLFRWAFANISLEQSIRIREETTFEDAVKVYLLFPSALQRNESTLNGLISLRQDWSFLNAYPNWRLTFRYQRDDEEDNQFDSVKEDRLFEQQTLRLDRSLSQLITANVQVGRELRQRSGVGIFPGTGSTFDVQGLRLAGGWGLRFSKGSTLDGELEVRRQEDDESAAKETAVSFRPRFVYRFSNTVNIFGRYEAIRFSTVDGGGVRPFFFSNSGTTHRWTLTPNIKVSKLITVLGTYEGRSEETFLGKRVTEHDFRIETRAFF